MQIHTYEYIKIVYYFVTCYVSCFLNFLSNNVILIYFNKFKRSMSVFKSYLKDTEPMNPKYSFILSLCFSTDFKGTLMHKLESYFLFHFVLFCFIGTQSLLKTYFMSNSQCLLHFQSCFAHPPFLPPFNVE